MSERLWKVSQRFAGGADLLRVKSEMIGVAEQFFEQQPGVVESSRIRSSGIGTTVIPGCAMLLLPYTD